MRDDRCYAGVTLQVCVVDKTHSPNAFPFLACYQDLTPFQKTLLEIFFHDVHS